MQNKNQKEIDIIVEEIEKILDIRKLAKLHWQQIPRPQNMIIDEEEVIRVLGLKFEKIANSILTKLKENEIVLAKGKIIRMGIKYYIEERMGSDIEFSDYYTEVNELLNSFEKGKIIKDNEGKIITLKVMVKDE